MTAPTILTKETNARFWLLTNYKPNQNLDMSKPDDRAMSKAWLEINRQVKAEDATGRLVITYDRPVDRPVVMHTIADVGDAHVIDRTIDTQDSTDGMSRLAIGGLIVGGTTLAFLITRWVRGEIGTYRDVKALEASVRSRTSRSPRSPRFAIG